ncbi:MAG: 2,3-bisphosphoglycerate-independent phosphoglycerate mutase [Gemmatimonadota bacterium]
MSARPPITRTARAVALIILDGWGYREACEANAICQATTPHWDRIWSHPSRTLLTASGRAVGLPDGQMGNSEVGHLNLGAGRVVMQDLVRIGASIEDGSFVRNAALTAACAHVKRTGGTLHLVGLIGDGGVHATDAHLLALVELAAHEQVPRTVVHAMLDGRDTPPSSGMGYLRGVLSAIAGRAQLASVSGRYFGMDRDTRWERTATWYRAAVQGHAPVETDAVAALQRAYDRGVTDEFVEPWVMAGANGEALAPMRDGDAVICFNFRSDRMRQTLRALAMPEFDGFDTGTRPAVAITTMTRYDETFPFPVAFAPQSMAHLVGEVIADAGLTQLRTAETEKYPHVTFFFNGGRDAPFAGEDRRMVPSPKVATYDLQPSMSAPAVCDILCDALANRTHDFMLCNFANTDMVGHTGSLPAAIAAVETVDACLGRILEAAAIGGARLIITADHGNADLMVDPDTGAPHTAHTTNPVPLVLLDPDGAVPLRSGGALCDVGPTALALLGVPMPPEITGRDLRDLSVTSPATT